MATNKARSKIRRFLIGKRRCASRAFTLLELLVVVAIMAMVAGVGGSLVLNTGETVAVDLVQYEIREVRGAILQFQRDTGFLPRTGPFDLAGYSEQGRVVLHDPTKRTDWFYSPANFDQLLEEPLDRAGNPVMPWNIHRGRGWRGPYLRQPKFTVTVGDALRENGAGSPAIGTILPPMPGIDDPFIREAERPFLVWQGSTSHNDDDTSVRLGRPFYFLDWNDRDWARIVSSGPNGLYESQILAGRPSLDDEIDIGDDMVLYLFR